MSPQKQLNITDDYYNHKKRIDGILKQIEIIKNLKYSIKRKDLRSSILPYEGNKRKGRVAVIGKDKLYIYQKLKTRSNYILINVRGILINYKKFFQKFMDKGLVIGRNNIRNEIKSFEELKLKNMEEYRRENGIPRIFETYK